MEDTIERRTGRLSDAWATRPARPREGRMVAGVAAALGHRYDIDPVLVRVAFATAAFFGPGIPLYLVGCAVLPDAGSAGTGKTRTVLSTVLLAGAALIVVALLFGGDGGWLAPLMVCLGLLALLHITRGGTPRGRDGDTTDPAATTPSGATPDAAAGPAEAGPPPTPEAAAPAATTSTTIPAATSGTTAAAVPEPATGPAAAAPTTATGPGDRPTAAVPGRAAAAGPYPPPATPPSWDPLGAAPFAWDLPDLAPAEPEPAPEPHSRLTAVTLGLALLAGGGAGAATLAAPGVVGPVVVPAAALAVLGVGLVVGAFRHAGRWLLPFAALLAVATWLVAALPWADLRGGVGTIADAPTSPASVAPEYRRGVGDVALDLSGLDLRTPPGAPVASVRTTARVGIGSIAVTVPRDADVVVRGTSGLGDVTVDGQSRSGSSAELTVVDDGPDGPGGGRIELDAHAALGSVTVGRG